MGAGDRASRHSGDRAAATGAVEAGLEAQKAIVERNAPLPEARRMRFRLGITLGDVIEKDDGSVYGDGVDIASRLERLCEPDEICVSGSVFEQVEGKLGLTFKSIGEQQVKNIPKPVRAYRGHLSQGHPALRSGRGVVVGTAALVAALLAVTVAWKAGVLNQRATPGAAVTAGAPSGPPELNDLPSLAVLPFKAISSGTEYEWFTDGVTQTLLTDLSRLSHLLVIFQRVELRVQRQDG